MNVGQNVIELCEGEGEVEGASREIEAFLLGLNRKVSRGIPVGPSASIIMAEAVLDDVDEWILHWSKKYARYVDDIRLFDDDPEELERQQRELTAYL